MHTSWSTEDSPSAAADPAIERRILPAAAVARGAPDGAQAPPPGCRHGDHDARLSLYLPLILDEIDYGMLLVDADCGVHYHNQVARQRLAQDGHPLVLEGGRLQTRDPAHGGMVDAAVRACVLKGHRRLLTLSSAHRHWTLALVPMQLGGTDQPAALLTLGKDALCEKLTMHWFGACHGLTLAEQSVLAGLCSGLKPGAIAAANGVAVSTIRSQVGSIRTKTGTTSIRALIQAVATLPPVLNALRH